MEKRRFRMGVNDKYFVSTKKVKIDFLDSQSYWGHHKQIMNNSLNLHFLGTKNNFVLLNPDSFVEYSKRSAIFCAGIISNNGQILFVSPNNNLKKITVFFGSRSLQPIYFHDWIDGSITNNLIKKPTALIVITMINSNFILKEALKSSIPIISIEDSDYSLNKTFYSSFVNDDNKFSICYFYSLITELIIKSLLYKQIINK